MSSHLIVVVDDETLVRDTVRAMLERSGYHVASFECPMAALAFFKEKPAAVDLVIVDDVMPGMSGERLANDMKSLLPELPILMLTGTVYQQCSKNIDTILHKPIFKLELLEAVQALLR